MGAQRREREKERPFLQSQRPTEVEKHGWKVEVDKCDRLREPSISGYHHNGDRVGGGAWGVQSMCVLLTECEFFT